MATDAIALFPSIEKEEGARITRVMIERSEVEFEEIDYGEALILIEIHENEHNLIYIYVRVKNISSSLVCILPVNNILNNIKMDYVRSKPQIYVVIKRIKR